MRNHGTARPKKQYSIRRYLTINLTFWALVMTLIPALVVYYEAAHEVEEIFDANLAQSSRVLNGVITRNTIHNKQQILDSLNLKDTRASGYSHSYERKLAFQIWDNDKRIINSPFAPISKLSDLTEGFTTVEIEGEQWRAFTLYSTSDKWWLVVAEETEVRQELVNEIAISNIIPISIFVPLLVILVWFITKRGLKPLNTLSETVKQRNYRNLEKLEDNKAPLEVNELLLELNSLFGRLDEAHQRERRFVGDAAHELRTPLASLLIHAENAIDESLIDDTQSIEVQQQNQAELQTSLYSMKKGISRMTHLVNQLLSLSRTEGQVDKSQFEPLDIREICHQAILFEEDKLAQKQQSLIADISDDELELAGNSALMQSLLRNVIDNAIRYTPDQGKIKLSCHLHANKQKVIIKVADSGPGVEAELRSRITERFYRVVGSGQQGSGLGLSIVDKIVLIHDASWHLDESEWGGLAITFEFPVVTEA
ncbi:hypothetical protein A9Q77_05760 [Marinomonas sp. 42_23_T18]|nr:hypothetical protein A9Q77_05760 [Marinomonas sp. 42_23_T18]